MAAVALTLGATADRRGTKGWWAVGGTTPEKVEGDGVTIGTATGTGGAARSKGGRANRGEGVGAAAAEATAIGGRIRDTDIAAIAIGVAGESRPGSSSCREGKVAGTRQIFPFLSLLG